MGKVKKYHVFISESGRKFANGVAPKISEDIDLYVNSKGDFYARINEKFIQALTNIGVLLSNHPSKVDKYGKAYIIESSIDKLESKIHQTLRRLVEYTEVERKTIIRYSFGYKGNFTIDKDNVIRPNGVRTEPYEWFESNIGNNHFNEPYGINLGILVLVKKTVEFPSGDRTIVYDRYDQTHTKDEDTLDYYLDDLDKLVRINVSGKYQEIDATYENAKAMHQLIFGMLEIMLKFQFLTNQDNLLGVINNCGNLLGNGTNISDGTK